MKFDYIQLCDIDIEVIDGDRGKTYPHQDELTQDRILPFSLCQKMY